MLRLEEEQVYSQLIQVYLSHYEYTVHLGYSVVQDVLTDDSCVIRNIRLPQRMNDQSLLHAHLLQSGQSTYSHNHNTLS